MNRRLIEVHDLAWTYREDGLVLNGISFEVLEGEIVGIVGPNGCGKTTLLHLMAGLLDPETHGDQSGSVYVKVPRNSHLGFVFQDYRRSLLPWRTVYGNIAAGRELVCTVSGTDYGLTDNEMVLQRIDELGLMDVRDQYPFEISGGQAQLTCVARALALNAQVLMLDEATSSLHYSARNTVLDVLLRERVETGLTIVFSSHSLEEASFLADRVLVLSSIGAERLIEAKSSLGKERRASGLGSAGHLDLYKHLVALTTSKAGDNEGP